MIALLLGVLGFGAVSAAAADPSAPGLVDQVSDAFQEAASGVFDKLVQLVGMAILYMAVAGVLVFALARIGAFTQLARAFRDVVDGLGLRDLVASIAGAIGGLVRAVTG